MALGINWKIEGMVKVTTKSIRFLVLGILLSIGYCLFFVGVGITLSRNYLSDTRQNYFRNMAAALAEAPNYEFGKIQIARVFDRILGATTYFWILDSESNIQIQSHPEELPPDMIEYAKKLGSIDAKDVVELRKGAWLSSNYYSFLKIPNSKNDVLIIKTQRKGMLTKMIWGAVLVTFVSALLLWLIVGGLFTAYFRSRAREVEKILQQIEAGQWQARLQHTRFDTRVGIFLNFNKIADQLGASFFRLRQLDLDKMHIVKELIHDLRTPLTSLRTAADALGDQQLLGDDKKRQVLFRIINDEIHYLNQLLEDLFALSEVQTVQSSSVVVDFNEILSAECERFKFLNDGLNIDRTGDLKQRLFKVSHPLLLQRLFANIFQNSINAQATQIDIKITDGELGLCLVFKDNGCGISESKIAEFGKKRRIRQFQKTNFHGSLGLGSVIICQIVIQLGGEISVKNRDDSSGVIIEIKLPNL